MDPQSAAFTPRDDVWRWHGEMLRVHQVQADHAERLLRLERRQDDDARMKSVWGTSSPFPSILSGTPQQGPLHQPPADAFSGFDDQQATLLGSLHLDTEEEPRRLGATSRANSVRFDESANQGHWSHASRPSVDLISRTGSGMAHPIFERSYSHKSDGRQSSTGHSVHSMVSGRANSLGIDTTFGISHSNHSPTGDLPGLAPGLFLLGPVPSIIRCWLTTKFKHDSLIYAAICTGSYTSYIGSQLLDHLGYPDRIIQGGDGFRKVKLDVYLPEAVAHPAGSRSSSPAPQVPSINVEFTVQDTSGCADDSKAIQVFIASDVLRAHNADVLLSSNTVTLFDDERQKLSVPLVRPEDERAFKSLCTISQGPSLRRGRTEDRTPHAEVEHFNGLGVASANVNPTHSGSERDIPMAASRQTPLTDNVQDSTLSTSAASSPPLNAGIENVPTPAAELPLEPKPRTSSDAPPPAGTRPGSSPAIWGSWRRDPSLDGKPSQLDWAGTSRGSAGTGATYQRRDQGIKVLKPLKSSTRSVSSVQGNAGAPLSPVTGVEGSSTGPRSRFFDEGKRRLSTEGVVGDAAPPPQPPPQQQRRRAPSNDVKFFLAKDKEKDAPGGKPRSANPVGGASAFSWLKGGGAPGVGAGAGAGGSKESGTAR